VYKADTKNQKYFAKRKSGQEVEIPFEHKPFQRAFMTGDKITESQYNEF
jgi:hypothetical protein